MLRNFIVLQLMLVFSESFKIVQNEEFEAIEDHFETKTLKRSKRVVGGFPNNIEQLPYMINIRRDGVFECGGALITPSCVLTAAHCIKTGRPENFTVRGGNTYLDDKRHSRRVKRIHMHELYDNKTLNNDIAIFELQTPLLQRKRLDQPFGLIKYATKWTEMPMIEDSIQVSGWGLTSETSTHPSNQLRSVRVNVIPQTKCQQLYRSYRNVTANMFCASVPGKRDACSADSGGPAVYNGKVVGIVSWGKGYECARADSPGVYVNVVALSDWIDAVLGRACQS